MLRLEYAEDYDRLLQKKEFSVDDRKNILEYQRLNKLFQPDLTIIHGSQLIAKHASGLKEDVWAVYEQVCLAALHLGMMAWSAHCVEKLIEKFPDSKRVKRIYALYREAVGEWEEAAELYKQLLIDAPENTFARKRFIAIRRAQGKTVDAIEAANKYLQICETDRDAWHELGEMYMEEAQIGKAMFCFEDVILQDCRNTYAVLSYAEMAFSSGQDFDTARKYFCLACEVDDRNVRALWGLFLCNVHLAKKDQGNDKMQQLQQMCLQKLRTVYAVDLKHIPCSKYMLQLLEDEAAGVEATLAKEASGGGPRKK